MGLAAWSQQAQLRNTVHYRKIGRALGVHSTWISGTHPNGQRGMCGLRRGEGWISPASPAPVHRLTWSELSSGLECMWAVTWGGQLWALLSELAGQPGALHRAPEVTATDPGTNDDHQHLERARRMLCAGSALHTQCLIAAMSSASFLSPEPHEDSDRALLRTTTFIIRDTRMERRPGICGAFPTHHAMKPRIDYV